MQLATTADAGANGSDSQQSQAWFWNCRGDMDVSYCDIRKKVHTAIGRVELLLVATIQNEAVVKQIEKRTNLLQRR